MTRPSSCHRADGQSKVTYYSRADARQAARNVHGRTGERFVPYKCISCRSYHIAHERRDAA